MRFLTLILTLLLTGTASAQQLVREFIQQDVKKTELARYLGDQCYNSVEKFYKQGGILRSESLIQQSVPLSDFNRFDTNLETVRTLITGTSAGYYTFYHYTDVQSLATDFKSEESNRDQVDSEAGYRSIMSYVKDPSHIKMNGQYFSAKRNRFSSAVMYVSSCPTCSSEFGNIQLSFTLAPVSRVLDLYGKVLWSDKIENEVRSKYPEVFKSCEYAKMELLIFEDSGIDLIKYSPNWYQLISFKNALNSDVMIFPTSDYSKPLIDQETKKRSESRTYSVNPK